MVIYEIDLIPGIPLSRLISSGLLDCTYTAIINRHRTPSLASLFFGLSFTTQLIVESHIVPGIVGLQTILCTKIQVITQPFMKVNPLVSRNVMVRQL